MGALLARFGGPATTVTLIDVDVTHAVDVDGETTIVYVPGARLSMTAPVTPVKVCGGVPDTVISHGAPGPAGTMLTAAFLVQVAGNIIVALTPIDVVPTVIVDDELQALAIADVIAIV